MTKFERIFNCPCTENNVDHLKEIVRDFIGDDGWDTYCLSCYIRDVSSDNYITDCSYDCAHIDCDDCLLCLSNIKDADEFIDKFIDCKTNKPFSFRNNLITGEE